MSQSGTRTQHFAQRLQVGGLSCRALDLKGRTRLSRNNSIDRPEKLNDLVFRIGSDPTE